MSVLLAFVFFAGLALVAFGAWAAYRPLGYAVAGLALIVVATQLERSRP